MDWLLRQLVRMVAIAGFVGIGAWILGQEAITPATVIGIGVWVTLLGIAMGGQRVSARRHAARANHVFMGAETALAAEPPPLPPRQIPSRPRPFSNRYTPPAWLAAATVTTAVTVGLAWGDGEYTNVVIPPNETAAPTRTSRPEPDRVVGFVERCEYRTSLGFCPTDAKYLEVTVRTTSGRTYTVDVNHGTHVDIGDRWPP